MLEYRILSKRQALRDLLRYALTQSPVFLSVIKDLRFEISVCDCALMELNRRPVARVNLR